jgi:hypothetical protein
MRIQGSKPRTFPAGTRQERSTLQRVYSEVGEYIVPEGQVLVVPEHGAAPGGCQEVRHEFPAGTRFRVAYVGDLHSRSVTDVLYRRVAD